MPLLMANIPDYNLPEYSKSSQYGSSESKINNNAAWKNYAIAMTVSSFLAANFQPFEYQTISFNAQPVIESCSETFIKRPFDLLTPKGIIEMIKYGNPVFGVEVRSWFMSIPEVEEVKINYDESTKNIHFDIFVHMPIYNDELIEKLISIEMDAEDDKRSALYNNLSFMHLPIPYVDIDARDEMV